MKAIFALYTADESAHLLYSTTQVL